MVSLKHMNLSSLLPKKIIFFIYLLVICSSLRKYLFRPVTHLLNSLFFSWLNFLNLLYILDINTLDIITSHQAYFPISMPVLYLAIFFVCWIYESLSMIFCLLIELFSCFWLELLNQWLWLLFMYLNTCQINIHFKQCILIFTSYAWIAYFIVFSAKCYSARSFNY